MKPFILLGLIFVGPATAADTPAAPRPIVGKVIMLMFDGAWLLQYDNKRYSCETTSLCHGFGEGTHFIPNMAFGRDKELIDYITNDHKWNDCILRNCAIY
jgi:hypothetical protein